MSRKGDESIFWERIADMPAWEAEQELVLRRENNALEIVMLQSLMAEELEASNGRKTAESRRIGEELYAIGAQNSLINERIKYLRRLQDSISWRRAVRAVCGDDAYEECAQWCAREEVEKDDKRREWAKCRA